MTEFFACDVIHPNKLHTNTLSAKHSSGKFWLIKIPNPIVQLILLKLAIMQWVRWRST